MSHRWAIGLRPSGGCRLESRSVRRAFHVLLWTCAFLLLVCGYAWLAFGSLRNMSAYLAGDCIVTEPSILDLGQVELGHEYTADFVVRNVSSDSVMVLGAKSCCGCGVLSGLPVTLQAHQETTVSLWLRIPSKQPETPLAWRALLLTDKGGGRGPMLTVHAEAPKQTTISNSRPPRT